MTSHDELKRAELAKIALAAWVGVTPDQLPPEKMWIEHPNHDSRKAWDRVIEALRAPLLSENEALRAALEKAYRISIRHDHEITRLVDLQDHLAAALSRAIQQGGGDA